MIRKIRQRKRGKDDDSDSDKNRRQLRTSKSNDKSNEETSFKTCLQFLFMSSIIPALLFLRMAQNDEDSFLRYKLSLPESLEEPFDFLPDLLRNYADEIRKYPSELDNEWLDSDYVELHHCRSILTQHSHNNGFWTNFTNWASPLVNQTQKQLQPNFKGRVRPEDQEILQQEIILELLEIYGTQYGLCKFDRYRPTIVSNSGTGRKSLIDTARLIQAPPNHARCAFVIAIYRRDINHVKRLLQAIHMPHHFIVLHLHLEPQQTTTDPFPTELLELAQTYDNVVVIPFTSNVNDDHLEDPRSNIQLKIMRWLTADLHLDYDYHITLDGASFPLLSAGELAKRLYVASQSQLVWLGSLTEQGKMVHDSQRQRLLQKRLATTSVPGTAQLGDIFPAASTSLTGSFPGALLNQRTTSGSYAIFSQPLVRRILHSPMSLQILAMSKYGCCGNNLDNYNWMAALQLLLPSESESESQSQVVGTQSAKLRKQAKSNTAMFQLWGGTQDCTNSKQSAILTMDPTLCYRIEHPQVVKSVYNESFASGEDWAIPKERLTLQGGEALMKHIRHAKQLGFLFAREFDSQNPQSELVVDAIERDWVQ